MIENYTRLLTPLNEEKIKDLKSGDMVYLTGSIYSARDMAHKRMFDTIIEGRKLPLDLKDSVIFYLGPSPTPPGKKSGGIGPTTSARMDRFTEPLLKKGLRAMIGKGSRSPEIRELVRKYMAIYFVAIGGVAAYLSTRVESIKPVAYEDLGPEAVYELNVRDFPLFVAYDIHGGDIFTDIPQH